MNSINSSQDIAQRLDCTFEQQCEMQLSRLKNELVAKAKKQLTSTASVTRLSKDHFYDYIDGYKKHFLKKQLLYILKQLALVISKNIKNSDLSNPQTLPIVDRKNTANFYLDGNDVLRMKSKNKIKFKNLGLAGQAFMLHLIAKTVTLINSDNYMSKRELFYKSFDFCKAVKKTTKSSQSQSQAQTQDSGLSTQSQSNLADVSQSVTFKTKKLDETLDDLCCFVGCSRIDLNIVSQAKGLVYGNLRYSLESGERYDAMSKKSGILIPSPNDAIVHVDADANFILILEKDSVLQKILELEEQFKFIERYKVILFTAKGYPDINSRAFIKFLWIKLKLPMFVLADADPYGIEIMCCYRYGSYATAYDASNLAVPQIQWLGLLPSDMLQLSLPTTKTQPLTNRDHIKLERMTSRSYFRNKLDLLHQINLMREFGRKAELEALDSCGEYIVKTYLPNKLRYASWL